MKRIHRLGRGAGVACAALVLVVGATFASDQWSSPASATTIEVNDLDDGAVDEVDEQDADDVNEVEDVDGVDEDDVDDVDGEADTDAEGVDDEDAT